MSNRRSLLVLFILTLILLLFVAGGAATALSSQTGAHTGGLSPENPAFSNQTKDLTASAGLADRALGFTTGPQAVSYARGMRVPSARLFGSLPASYDLRSLGRVTSVKDQGQHGACWTFASLGSLESFLMPSQNLNFSEDNMALTHGFDHSGDIYNRGGNYFMSTAYLARWSGPVYESDDAYGDYFTPSGLTARKHVQEVDWLPSRASATDNDNIKNAVMQYGGGAVAYRAEGNSWGSAYYNASTHSYYYNGSGVQNHGVLIVGWNDNYAASNFATTPPGDGAFIVKNSWGTGWGDGGYFYLSYYDTVLGYQMFPAVFQNAESTSNYSNVYQYDPLGYCAAWGDAISGDAWWGANVFTATSASLLKAVGFYTLTPNSAYEV